MKNCEVVRAGLVEPLQPFFYSKQKRLAPQDSCGTLHSFGHFQYPFRSLRLYPVTIGIHSAPHCSHRSFPFTLSRICTLTLLNSLSENLFGPLCTFMLMSINEKRRTREGPPLMLVKVGTRYAAMTSGHSSSSSDSSASSGVCAWIE